ncbi:MAG TPA: hypothetical protein PKH62_02715, partial [Methanoculleus sp.]|nr:hypothetical protein [Methanoculleus sp.]
GLAGPRDLAARGRCGLTRSAAASFFTKNRKQDAPDERRGSSHKTSAAHAAVKHPSKSGAAKITAIKPVLRGLCPGLIRLTMTRYPAGGICIAEDRFNRDAGL